MNSFILSFNSIFETPVLWGIYSPVGKNNINQTVKYKVHVVIKTEGKIKIGIFNMGPDLVWRVRESFLEKVKFELRPEVHQDSLVREVCSELGSGDQGQLGRACQAEGLVCAKALWAPKRRLMQWSTGNKPKT